MIVSFIRVPIRDEFYSKLDEETGRRSVHAVRIEYFGFTQNVAFTVSPDMSPVVEIHPDVTLVETRFLRQNGEELDARKNRIALCPTTVKSLDKKQCIWSDTRRTYAPSGIYRAFNHRWYGKGNADKFVEINQNRKTQLLTFTEGETAKPHQ